MLSPLWRSLLLAVLWVAIGSAGAEAQAPGDTVRLTRHDGSKVTGTVVERTDTLWTVVATGGDTVVVSNYDLQRRELRRARDVQAVRRRVRARAAAVGAIVAGSLALVALPIYGVIIAVPVGAVGGVYFGTLATVGTLGLNEYYWQIIR